MIYKIQCANCKQVMECDESILEIRRPACGSCGAKFSVNDYSSLRKLKEDKEAEKAREKERRALEAKAAWEAKQQAKRENQTQSQAPVMNVSPRASRSSSMRGIPDYKGLLLVSMIFGCEALLCYIGAVILVVIAVILAIKSQVPFVGLPFLYGACCAFVLGVFYHAAKHGCLALRDIAMNSFR